jgi:hypothetical protein
LRIASTVAPAAALDTAPPRAPLPRRRGVAKKLANPVAAISAFQLNYDHDIGAARGGDRWQLNIQPVLPIDLNPEWNLISRTILPVVWQDEIYPGAASQSGIGDIVQSVFFSPKAPTAGGWIWGAGPVLLLPTGSDDLLSVKKWGAGPTGVALKQDGPWTTGCSPTISGRSPERQAGRERDLPSALRQLHHADRVVLRAQHRKHLRLGTQPVGRAGQRGRLQGDEGRRPAGERGRRRALLGRRTGRRSAWLGIPLRRDTAVPEVRPNCSMEVERSILLADLAGEAWN